METLEIKGHAGHPIHSLRDWENYAMPPDRKRKHWKKGRSACELGRIWTANGEPAVPSELIELLNSHDATRGTVIRSGITEHETRLPPSGSHGPRCHDLALLAAQGQSAVTICIEAKADEPFGATVADELRKADKRPRTKFRERLDWLTRSLLGLSAFKGEDRNSVSDEIRNLPYQLLTATAGTLLEAELRHSTKAILVIHEFRTPDDQKMERNASELNRFVRLLLQQNGAAEEKFQLRCGQLIGPLPLLERSVGKSRKLPYQIPFFVGKIRTDRSGVSTEASVVQ